MKKEKELDVLYFSLHNHLKKKFGNKPLSKKEFFALLGRHFLIPKPLRIVVLKEMEQRKLVEMIDKQNLVVSNIVINVGNSASEFYKKMGFY